MEYPLICEACQLEIAKIDTPDVVGFCTICSESFDDSLDFADAMQQSKKKKVKRTVPPVYKVWSTTADLQEAKKQNSSHLIQPHPHAYSSVDLKELPPGVYKFAKASCSDFRWYQGGGLTNKAGSNNAVRLLDKGRNCVANIYVFDQFVLVDIPKT